MLDTGSMSDMPLPAAAPRCIGTDGSQHLGLLRGSAVREGEPSPLVAESVTHCQERPRRLREIGPGRGHLGKQAT